MNILTLEQIKNHLNLDPDDDSEDGLLCVMGDAAEKCVFNYLERSIDNLWDDLGEIPSAVTMGILLVVGDLYKNRESTLSYSANVSPVIGALLKPYVLL